MGDGTADVSVTLFLETDTPAGTATTVRLTQRFQLQAVTGKWLIAAAPATDGLPPVGSPGVFYVFGGC
jgi:hypothetical protein